MMKLRLAVAAAFAMLAGAVCALPAMADAQTGKASYYKHGHRTASGEHFNAGDYTAAHRSLPFGTRVLVTNLETGISVIVRVNDRGPFIKSRIIDVSYAAAKMLGITRSGVARVKIVPLYKTAETAPAAVPSSTAAVKPISGTTEEVVSLR